MVSKKQYHFIKNFARKMEGLVLIAFDENKAVIEDMNTDQLWSGKRSDGKSLPNYSPVSVAVYGKPPGAIRLYDEGDFYAGIQATAGADGVVIEGTDGKTDELETMYGTEIIGLTEENKNELQENYIKPTLQRIILKLHGKS